jgi:arylsulfatase A-like enzyme
MTDAGEFLGVIGDTWRESTPWWPPLPTPPDGAPNVLVIVLDDVGYAQLGCYGSDIDTPNIDRLAHDGVRLANFHTTALCSPTRSCLLTGRNHHSNGMGRVADLAVGFPGYLGRIPRRNGMLGEILRANGYATFAVGKWHLTPDDETHMGASRATWPTQRGFDRWYGFHGGEAHQFVPALFQDNHAVVPPARDGYHLSEDLADRCIEYLADQRAVTPDQPWFAYFATGACHSPHQAPAEWIDRFSGRFDDGWDAWRERTHRRQLDMGLLPVGTELAPRPHWVPDWESLGDADRRVAARFMECFAGFLSHADAQIGRVLDFIEYELHELDNTIVVLISDNGASAEGGPKGSINDARIWNGDPAGRRELRARIGEIGTESSHNNYPWGWTMAGNTPFRRWKREVHEGGIADPCILRYPPVTASSAGSIRHQFTHVIDVLPTVLDLCGVEVPDRIDDTDQAPIDGTSFSGSLRTDDAPPHRTTQYFEMLGSRGIHHDGWKAVTFKPLGAMYDDGLDPDAPFDEDVWELYHVAQDFSECHDLASTRPEKLAELVSVWWNEARRYQVLPLDNRPLAALMAPRHSFPELSRYVFWPSRSIIAENVTVNTRNRSHRIVASVDLPEGVVASGVLLAMGTVLGGWSFHLRNGRLRYSYNRYGAQLTEFEGSTPIESGAHELESVFTSRGDFTGSVALIVDGTVVGGGDVPRTTPVRHSIIGSGLTCGWEQGPPVGTGYAAPYRCNFELRRVVVEVEGVDEIDPIGTFARIMSEQ